VAATVLAVTTAPRKARYHGRKRRRAYTSNSSGSARWNQQGTSRQDANRATQWRSTVLTLLRRRWRSRVTASQHAADEEHRPSFSRVYGFHAAKRSAPEMNRTSPLDEQRMTANPTADGRLSPRRGHLTHAASRYSRPTDTRPGSSTRVIPPRGPNSARHRGCFSTRRAARRC
jgi:hypothetical protein